MIPELFLRRMSRTLGTAYPDFLRALSRPRAVGLRLNTLKVPADFVQKLPFGFAPDGFLPFTDGLPEAERKKLLSGAAMPQVPWAPTGYYYDPATRPGLHAFHDAGAYYLQEPSAMLPAELADVRPGMTVLDLCAAPGGKTTQLAAKLRGEGLLIANELVPQRARILARNVERCGIANCIVLNEHPARLLPRFAGYFDRIVVDAPCSGEGMFRKEDAAATDWSPETVEMCAGRQREILRTAVQMLKPGGRLVYSTCTFSEEENEKTVAACLAEHPELRLISQQRILPHEQLGEGHFAAVVQKTDGAPDESDSPGKPNKPAEAETAALRFADDEGLSLPSRRLISFGATVWSAPKTMPELNGLRVLRCGLELGELRGKLFFPAHAWALWLKAAPNEVSFAADGAEISAYLHGGTVADAHTGWVLLKADGLSVGWTKGSGGILKNHYPKGLRRIAAEERRPMP